MSAESQSVRSQVIPLIRDHVVVPSVAIAEVVNLSEIEPIPDAPEWVVGHMSWRGIEVPLLSVASMGGEDVDEDELVDSRVVILHCNSKRAGVNNIGILSHGLPHLLQLQHSNTTYVENSDQQSELARCTIEVRHNEQLYTGYILDIELFEQRYRESL